MHFTKVSFLLSAHKYSQLPPPEFPDIAFAGRSNVGKSSLINTLINRRNYVKISSKPGKTQSLNYFLVDETFYLVDLPGYGFARVSRQVQNSWEKLITKYLESRENLACVVVIMDLRHELKHYDRELIDWLKHHGRQYLPVYTKADKLSRNIQLKHAAALDAGLTITASERVIFSSKTGLGCEELKSRLALHKKN